ncbi:MAG TPA: Gfo/Idh/MocA family oxidoreductase [Solirubrobacterales bacterium]|nr:Gfo/Idh/MocA family oxidoreductase [Solirubrobacterales bacterium]
MSNENGTRSPLRFGLIGLGYWGPNLLRVIADMQDTEVKWICDLDDQRLERFGRRYPSSTQTTDVNMLLEDPELDAIVIATPVFTHFDLASKALRAGKHTFVEKPLASSSAEANQLLRLAEIEAKTLMCGHTFIYSPPVRAVKTLLDAGELGEIFFVSSSRVNLGLHQPDVSVIWDLGPHDFSILLHWLGETPRRVRAVGRDSIVPGIPDVAFITLNYDSGIVANVELSWLAPSKLRRTVVVGSQKMVVYDDGAPEPVRVFDHGVVYKDPETFGEHQLSYRTGDILSPKIDSCEPLLEELSDFAAAIRSGGEPLAGAAMARDVVNLVEAADRSLQEGGAEIEIESGASEEIFLRSRRHQLAVG